jgi:hypothetical protein
MLGNNVLNIPAAYMTPAVFTFALNASFGDAMLQDTVHRSMISGDDTSEGGEVLPAYTEPLALVFPAFLLRITSP